MNERDEDVVLDTGGPMPDMSDEEARDVRREFRREFADTDTADVSLGAAVWKMSFAAASILLVGALALPFAAHLAWRVGCWSWGLL